MVARGHGRRRRDVYVGANAVLMTPEGFVKRPIEWLARSHATADGELRAELRVRNWPSAASRTPTSRSSTVVVAASPAVALSPCTRRRSRPSPKVSGAASARRLSSQDTASPSTCGRHAGAAPARSSRRASRASDVSARRVATPANGFARRRRLSGGVRRGPPATPFRIVDDEGKSLPERHIGEIVLGGPSVSPLLQ